MLPFKSLYLIICTVSLLKTDAARSDLQMKVKVKSMDVTNKKFDPINYLINYGYLNSEIKHSSLKTNYTDETKENSVTMLKNAIKFFQKFANLNQTGNLDNATLEVMKLPRCGLKDFNTFKTKKILNREKRFVLQGSKWSKSDLKWTVVKYPAFSTMNIRMFDEELTRAFALWSSVSGLEFEQIFYGTGKADIEISFESGYHGDSEPFDGPGLILGHAFFPEFSGSTHFDADELWTSRRIDGVNFYQVAVHELGHALGLEHSDNYDAIMAPFFRGYTDDFSLHSDDKIAIQMLYGPKKPKATPSVSLFTLKSLIPQVDPRLSYLCSDGEFDAITQLSDLYTYIFKGAYVYKFDFERKLFRGYPKRINSVFRDWSHSGFISLPSNLDAVLYVPENKTTYFFKNNLYWKSSVLFEIDQGFPRLIYSDFKGLNSRNGFNGKLDAVFVWSGNRRTYFVSGNKYWRYDFSTGWIENGYPKDFSYWNGLNSKISNAFLYSDEKTYFFKNNVFYRFNDQSFKIDTEFLPRLNSEYWFMCQ